MLSLSSSILFSLLLYSLRGQYRRNPRLTLGPLGERLSSPRRLFGGRMKIDEVELAVPEGYQLILGQSHFIKTVEDLHETLASSMPGAKFGIAFCESSGKALIRYDGTDARSEEHT